MANIHFSLPLLPDPAGADVAKFVLPAEKVCAGPLVLHSEPKLSGDLISWCLQIILGDQYTEVDIAGAWSKRYPDYGDFILGETVRESITVSACIAEALVRYCTEIGNDKLKKPVIPRLDLLKDYLKGHYNGKDKGFGPKTAALKRGPGQVSVNIRHTAWAVIALWYLAELGIQDSETDEMLRNAAGSISNNLGSLVPGDQWACTYSALHKLLTTNGLASVVMPSDRSRRSALKRIEGVIVDKFVAHYGSWDPDDLKKDPKVSIDTALGVLGPIQISSCIDSECCEVLKAALGRLCEKSLIPVGGKAMALPFCEGGEPDIGATIELLWFIIKNEDVFKPEDGVVKKIINFIVNPSNRKGKLRFAYPWNLSSALLIATKSMDDKNMYITKIVLDNVRCFEHVEFDLAPKGEVQNWGVILGDNGMGKTTLIRSIAMGLCDETGAAGLLQDTYGDWVRWDKGKAMIKIDLLDGGRKCSIETTIQHKSDLKFEIVKQVTDPEKDFPWEKMFVCGYGANRSILGSELYEKYSLADSVFTLFSYRLALQSPEVMLRRRAVTQEEVVEVCAWLDEVLMLEKGATKLDEGGIKIKGSWGRDVYLGSLPDGHVATLTLILDMLGWASLKGLKNKKNKLSGIILIDEIEQHIHPSWQKYIIKLLHKVFPNLQFITTTHSPLCAIGTANLPEPEKVSLLVLSQEDDHVKGQDKIPPPRGKRADQVLTSYLFDLETTRSDDTLQRIERYSDLLEKKSLSKTERSELQTLKVQLKQELGSAETELQELVEKAVHDALDKLVATIAKDQKTPKEAINFEIRRQLNELLGKGELNDKD